MSDNSYTRIGNSSFVWLCPSCELPHYSHSLPHSASSISSPTSSHNSFSTLGSLSPNTTLDSLNSSGSSPLAASSPQRNHTNPKHLKVLTINCNSIVSQSKAGQFISLVTTEDPDIIIGTESKLDNTIANGEVFPQNYCVLRKDRQKGGGGVFLAIRDTFLFSERKDLNSDCETIFAEIQLQNNQSITVGSFYRPPGTPVEALHELDKSLRTAQPNNSIKNIILGGDFNLAQIDWPTLLPNQQYMNNHPNTPYDTTNNDQMIDIAQTHDLTQVQHKPTREDAVLDLVFTTHPESVSKTHTTPGISDHLAVLAHFDFSPKKLHKPSHEHFQYKKANYEGIRQDLNNLWTTHFDSPSTMHTSVNDDWLKFKNTLLQSMKKNIPTKRSSARKQPPWFTHEISRLLRRKARAHQKAQQNKTPEAIHHFRALRKHAKTTIRKAQSDYLTGIIDNVAENPRPFWKYIKEKRSDSNTIPTLKQNDQVAESHTDKASLLANQFSSVFTIEDTHSIPFSTTGTRPMTDIVFHTTGIHKLLQNLNANKASGPDQIPTRVLRETATETAPILQQIFQKSYNTSTCPDDWRDANISPIYKKGDKHNPANYRPVSLTSITCKLLEHIVHSSISSHLQEHNILIPNQHGFRKSHSCDTQLTLTVNDLASTLDKRPGSTIDMAILDFSKAFDTVPYERLLSKCHAAGIRGKTLSWIRSFLTNRRQRVLVSGSGSSWRPVTSGVPQGTVLGPLLFLIYINDITDDLSPDTTARLFADDCIIYRTITQPTDRTMLQQDLNHLHLWSQKWQMHFNPKKCTIMHLTLRNTPQQYPQYTLANEPLETVKEHKYLGVTISDNLNWNTHIRNCCNRASQILNLLRRNLKQCSTKTKTLAYQSLVRPHLEYATTAWDPHTQTNIDRLERIQRRAARFVLNNYNYPPSPNSSVTTMLSNLQWHPLHTRRTITRLTLFHRIVYQTVCIPNHFLTLAYRNTRANHPYKYLHLPCRINQYKYSFFPRTIVEWNKLPCTIVTLPSTDSFKTQLAAHLTGTQGYYYALPGQLRN